MPRSFDILTESPASVEEIHAAFGSEDYWLARLAASDAITTLDSLKPKDLQRTVTIRQEPHTVMQALNRALAHYAQHIGQLVFLAKHLRSSQWQSLSIPRGKSEDYKVVAPKAHKPAAQPK